MVPRAMRVCPCIGCAAHPGSCPELTSGGRCGECSRTADAARGSRQQRGYDAEHDRLRAHWKPKVESGSVECHAKTCVMPTRAINPGQRWDLDHEDDRRGWRGPAHERCNRGWRRETR